MLLGEIVFFNDPDVWTDETIIVDSPVNIENILNACPMLLEEWKREPFVFVFKDVGGDDKRRNIVVRYPLRIKG